MSELLLDVISPEREIYSGEVVSVCAPGAMSSFTVLKGHAPLISELVPGVFSINNAEKTVSFAIEGGFLEVRNNRVTALVENTAEPDDISSEEETQKLTELMKKITHSDEENRQKLQAIEYIRVKLRLVKAA